MHRKYPFYECSTEGKPHILLAGDDDGRAYHVVPLSSESTDWLYDVIPFLDEGPGQIVGGLTLADVDGDGFTEIFLGTVSLTTPT